MPTWLVKECLDVLIRPITKIANKSLSFGVLPRYMRPALVKPFIKIPVWAVIFYTITDLFQILNFYLKL